MGDAEKRVGRRPGSFSAPVALDKPGDGTVVRPFNIRGEETAGQLVLFAVIGNTLAAFPFPGTGFIGAGALTFIFFHMAFHYLPRTSL
jgi:hypothetical protein